MRILVFFIKFLFLSFFFIVSTLNLPLAVEDNLTTVTGEYISWVYDVTGEIGTLTGYVVEVRWLPEFEDSPIEEEILVGPRYSDVKR